MTKRNTFILLAILLTIGGWMPWSAGANTLTDVGVGLVPDFDPAQYDPARHELAWTLSSSCVDINENGEAACQAVALGPTYGCGWRKAQTCPVSPSEHSTGLLTEALLS